MTGSRPTVLLTGASGFVGGHVAPALTREGWVVRRAVRRPSRGDDEILIGSIGPKTDWQGAVAGVDTVIHLAARVYRQDENLEADRYRKVNTEGTLHLARCAADAGVRHFIFVSSALVHGRRNDGRAPICEDDLLTPGGAYAQSKAAAEDGLKAMAQDCDMSITVIRPPLIYGAGAKGNFNRLIRAVKLGLPLPFAAIRNRRAVLSVENLVSFILQRLRNAEGKYDVFLLADDEQVSTPEFVRRIAKAAGTTARLFPMPAVVLSTALRFGRQMDAHDSLIGSLELDVSKAAATGWRPQISLDEGLRLAMAGAGGR